SRCGSRKPPGGKRPRSGWRCSWPHSGRARPDGPTPRDARVEVHGGHRARSRGRTFPTTGLSRVSVASGPCGVQHLLPRLGFETHRTSAEAPAVTTSALRVSQTITYGWGLDESGRLDLNQRPLHPKRVVPPGRTRNRLVEVPADRRPRVACPPRALAKSG